MTKDAFLLETGVDMVTVPVREPLVSLEETTKS